MEVVEVINAGLYSTFQDLGRIGYLDQGVSRSGAMDIIAASNANIICGNHPNTPIIECTLTGIVLKVRSKARIAVAGVTVELLLNDINQDIKHSISVEKEDIIKVKFIQGSRCYIAIDGGWQVKKVLGSCSYNMVAPLGDKPIKKGEVLRKNLAPTTDTLVTIARPAYNSSIIYVFKGPEYSWLLDRQRASFLEKQFIISDRSNRMSYLLEGQVLRIKKGNLLSGPVLPGTIQVTPSGLPVVLMNDCQTIGGYPRALIVAHESMPVLAQKKAGEKIELKIINGH